MEENTHEKLEDNSETYHLDLEYLKKKWYNKEELIELEKMCLIFIERDEDTVERKVRNTKLMYAKKLVTEKGMKYNIPYNIPISMDI